MVKIGGWGPVREMSGLPLVGDDLQLAVERAGSNVIPLQFFRSERRGPECCNTPNRKLTLA